MAYRGGGRGRGRGRSFGGRGFPTVRDEDGAALVLKTREGPPPLFPPLDALPQLPEITLKDEQLVSRRRHLESVWNVSPYYIEKPRPKSEGVAAEIERYSDKYKLKQAKRPPLGSVLKLAPAYFPAELLGQAKRGQKTKSSGPEWNLQAGGATRYDLQRLDQLATLEQKRTKDGDEKEVGDEEKKKDGNAEDGEEDDELVEDEEEDFADGDYAENFGYDDDEGYGEDDDGGDDDGATY